MKPIPMSAAFVLITLISQTALAQEPVAWEKEAAQEEIDGMRRYAWALSGKIGDSLKKAPVEDFPAVHAFLRDFHDARKAVDPEQAPSEWKPVLYGDEHDIAGQFPMCITVADPRLL